MEGDATKSLSGSSGRWRISTHALTWRATYVAPLGQSVGLYFYPRPHMEGDTPRLPQSLKKNISTHALTWRATDKVLLVSDGKHNFYPRPHMEGDSWN